MNTSCLSHRNYFINLRKSYHMNLSLAAANETQIFLGQSEGFNNKDCEFAGLINLKNDIEIDLKRIDTLLRKLEAKLDEYKFGLPTLLISRELAIYQGVKEEIDSVFTKMRSRLDTFKPDNNNNNNNDAVNFQFKTNLGAHLAQRLTEQFETFQVFQKMYNSILLERVNRPKVEQCINNNNINNDNDDNNDNIDNNNDPDSSSFMLVLDESQELMLTQRSQEIEVVLTDVNHVNDILNHIQVMAVEQGSLFDRIDVNLDRTRNNLTKAIGRLEQTATSFSLHQKRLILLFITLLIFLVSLGIFFK